MPIHQVVEGAPTVDRVIRAVADFYRIQWSRILGPSRQQEVVEARQVAMWLARTQLKLSFPRVGRAFRRHHTTVMAAVDRVDAILATGSGPLISQITRLIGTISQPADKDTSWLLQTDPQFIMPSVSMPESPTSRDWMQEEDSLRILPESSGQDSPDSNTTPPSSGRCKKSFQDSPSTSLTFESPPTPG